MKRRGTRQISIGGVAIGGDAPVSVQSMTNTDTADIRATVNQINALHDAGCEIVRVAVPNMNAAKALKDIKEDTVIPLIADIHFDYRLALSAIEAGIDGLRINPGNIGSEERVKEIVDRAAHRGIPIRIGVNGGSLEGDILSRYGHPTAEAMVESALRHINILEKEGFYDIKISLKAADVKTTIDAYTLLADRVDYPFHIGITEAGTAFSGGIKSAVGLGILLYQGIGDTVRVSLTGDPVQEVRVAWEILKALRLRERGVNIISCPTCGRIKVDAARLTAELEERLSHIDRSVNIAVMGCVVNGPGEAVQSDIGIACGDGGGLLYIGGRVERKVRESEIVDVVVEEVEKMVNHAPSAGNK